MPQVKAVGIIPARLGSTRFKEKMLADICGKPLIAWTARAALESGAFTKVIVATDHERIADVVKKEGFEAVLTDPALSSGTARVAEVAKKLDFPVIVNVQGDEPLIDGAGLRKLVEAFVDPAVEMATLSFPLNERDESNPNAVKVVIDKNGYALYFSRSLIPFPRNREHFAPLKHIGVYGYKRETLLNLVALPSCAIETTESLEQLRALYHGIRIKVVPAEKDSIGVDTFDDLIRVRQALENHD